MLRVRYSILFFTACILKESACFETIALQIFADRIHEAAWKVRLKASDVSIFSLNLCFSDLEFDTGI